VIAIVSTIEPETHYVRYLHKSLGDLGVVPLLWTEKNVWTPNWKFPGQIIWQTLKNKVDLVHFQHEFNMYGKVSGYFTFPLTLLLLKLLNKKIVVTIHAIPKLDEVDDIFLMMMGINKYCPSTKLAKLLFWCLFWTIGKLSNTIIVHSDYTKSVCVNDYGMKRVAVIPIGVAPVYGVGTNKWKKLTGNYILFFGYILERKGLEELLVAFEKCLKNYPKLKLVLAGGFLKGYENYVAKIKKLIKKLKLDKKVIFTGFLNSKEIDWLYRKTTMVVLPYVRSISSSFPLSFALGYGKPVVASDIGTLKGEFRNGIEGIYCKPKNVESLYQSMNKVLTDKKFKKIAIDKNRSWREVAKKTILIYEKNIRNS